MELRDSQCSRSLQWLLLLRVKDCHNVKIFKWAHTSVELPIDLFCTTLREYWQTVWLSNQLWLYELKRKSEAVIASLLGEKHTKSNRRHICDLMTYRPAKLTFPCTGSAYRQKQGQQTRSWWQQHKIERSTKPWNRPISSRGQHSRPLTWWPGFDFEFVRRFVLSRSPD